MKINNTQIKLIDIADIYSGYAFRSSIEDNPKGDISILQAKNIFANEDFIHTNNLLKLSSDDIRKPFFLKKGDILLVSRAAGIGSFKATIFVSDDNNIIASSSLIVIRIKDNSILAKYLCTYLNSDIGQREIVNTIKNNLYLQFVTISSLSNLKLTIPNINIQKNIILLQENVLEQNKILNRKKEILTNIINNTFTQLIN